VQQQHLFALYILIDRLHGLLKKIVIIFINCHVTGDVQQLRRQDLMKLSYYFKVIVWFKATNWNNSNGRNTFAV